MENHNEKVKWKTKMEKQMKYKNGKTKNEIQKLNNTSEVQNQN